MITASIVRTQSTPPAAPDLEQAHETLPKPRKRPLSASKPLLPATQQVVTPVEGNTQTTALAFIASASVETLQAVMPPRFDAAYLNNAAPSYPMIARRRGEQGKVLLYVLVKSDGSAGLVELRNSSGSSSLDQAALEAVKRWRFVPARLGNDNIDSGVLVPLAFHLEN